jgi:tyrosinase
MYWTETKRRPTPYNGINATSNNSYVARTFDSYLSSYQQRLYNLFSNYDNYSTWSNEAWIPSDNNGTFDSIESLHDTIHMACGGNFGHMAIIAYSSFDPLFFLLHAMVDRIFAMWQIVHNDSYVGPMANVIPTRTIEIGQIQDSQTNLTPFFYNDSSFWNSDLVRDHQVFGYSYAEVVNGNRSEVITSINNLYTDYSPARMFDKLEHSPLDGSRDGKNGPKHDSGGISAIRDIAWDGRSSTMPPVELILKNGSYREWVANIRVNKHAMNASFLVHLFLGGIPQDLSSWDFAHNLVGTMGIFAGNHARSSMPSQRIAGTVPLTSALVALVSSGDLHSLDPSDIEPFLKQYLGFRVALNDGSAVEPGGVDGLSISIVSSEVKAPESNAELASWGELASHFDVYQPL